MLNIQRIRWTYEHFGLAMSIRSAAIDIVALLAFTGYCLTLPFLFFLDALERS
jgi:hypothetical protein